MGNVPVNNNGPAHAVRSHVEHHPAPQKKKPASRRMLFVAAGIITLAIAAVVTWVLISSTAGAQIDRSKQQAVFLTNGQVYFGRLQPLNGDYMKLTDIFYLQAESTDGDSNNPQQTNKDKGADVQLVKLGNEVHGPEDAMIISKEQILFFENLKDDGKVTTSITQYQKQQNNQ